MIFALLAGSSALFATQPVDMDMSPQEKKQTGVYKLNDSEKKSLQDWIEMHYIKRGESLQEKMESAMLQENLKNGQSIRLSNGSLWNIHPQDVAITQGWLTPVMIMVSPTGDADYPYKLTNNLTNSSVRARKAQTAPLDIPSLKESKPQVK